MDRTALYLCSVLLSTAMIYGQGGRYKLRTPDTSSPPEEPTGPTEQKEPAHSPQDPGPPAQEPAQKPEEVTETASSDPSPCVCSRIYDPVCASNDKSYFNPCQMECDIGQNTSVQFVHQGHCIPWR